MLAVLIETYITRPLTGTLANSALGFVFQALLGRALADHLRLGSNILALVEGTVRELTDLRECCSTDLHRGTNKDPLIVVPVGSNSNNRVFTHIVIVGTKLTSPAAGQSHGPGSHLDASAGQEPDSHSSSRTGLVQLPVQT